MNVILILCDQLSARWLGCYGNDAAATPNIDALAAGGTRFERCISNLPVCMPARSTIITGRSAQNHGVFYNGWELGPGAPTFPQLLQAGGFQTLGVGKFHLECHGRSAHNDVLKYGFDSAQTTEDIRAGDWLDWVEKERPEDHERALATVWPMPHLSDYGPDHRNLLEQVHAARKKHPPEAKADMTYASVVPEETCQTRWIGDRAIDYLKGRDTQRPFLLKASFVDPHDPYDPPASYLDRIDPGRVPEPVTSDDASLGAVLERFSRVPFIHRFEGLGRDDWLTMRRHYLASVAFIDDQVGRIMQTVREEGLAEDTAIIFTADHGDVLGDHGLAAKGAWHFDACYRVPLIIAGPGVERQVVDRTATLLDIFPTAMDLSEVDCSVPVEGMSLRPLLEGGGDLPRPDAALVESHASYAVHELSVKATSVVTPQANMTLFGDGAGMLFDLQSDPVESVNLWDDAAAQGLKTEMKDLMCDLLIAQNVPLPHRGKHPTAQH